MNAGHSIYWMTGDGCNINTLSRLIVKDERLNYVVVEIRLCGTVFVFTAAALVDVALCNTVLLIPELFL